MKSGSVSALVFALAAWLPLLTSAQEVQKGAAIVSHEVASQVSAFSYQEGARSELDFRGTPLMPRADGEAVVKYKNGRAAIDVELDNLPQPSSLGPYTTYVLWAVTPDGRATNVGELAPTTSGDAELETSFAGSNFGLIVTVEPHFAVSLPSDQVGLINIASRVKGTESKITSLAERANYSGLAKITFDPKKVPVALVQARYAVAIAAAAGAEQYAPDAYAAAKSKLDAAEAAQANKKSSVRKQVVGLSREAVQAGEEARRAGMTARAAADEAAKQAAAAASAAELAAQVTAEEEQAKAVVAARNDLKQRLNRALPTTETRRGLVAELSGVQFASGTANLNASAREALARFAGIVSSYPSLKFSVEGHTDSVGSEESNRSLSYRRAISVRDYLIEQGLPASKIDVLGLGSAMPIADNVTPEGRAQNRRVEIVISGEMLGIR